MLRLLILIFALAAGAGAAWLTFSAPAARVADAPGPDLPPEVPTVTVLVAARAFAPGETLDPEGLRWQQWPVESGTDDLVVKTDDAGSIDDLAGVLVRREFLPGEPIRKAKLADGAGFLASLLPTGKRAVAVRISAENAAGGFVLPNDFVDVIFTRTRSADSGTAMESASRTLLRNIRVLAIDQTVEEGGDGGLSTLGKTATLELTPDQVETLMSAGASGTLSLSLRSALDSGERGADETLLAFDRPQGVPGLESARDPAADDDAATDEPETPAQRMVQIIRPGRTETVSTATVAVR